ncbi:cyclic nucleotide-gated ion channel 1-like [Hibiscus syriacus]|uniref:Non-specific lipid-transfer protein n=1 Tax=Hibiscus syriacus TaxID=106335 RepID=A0A6A3ADM3_HIBSY|nr:non-specific lipid-transfer protein 1-like [Hibiscus syriacus]KAE8701973.1 cyclic nucleotide-gated ion channel 1-like [Hibiscus syriacus]
MFVFLITTPDFMKIAAAPPCNNVVASLTPCLGFIKGGAAPVAECCSGARNLAGQVSGEEDRQAVCECLKGVLPRIGPYDPNRVPLIGQDCSIDISIPPIDASTDCST